MGAWDLGEQRDHARRGVRKGSPRDVRAQIGHVGGGITAQRVPQAGTYFLTQKPIPDRLGIVSITAAGESYFIHCAIEESHAKNESWISKSAVTSSIACPTFAALVRVEQRELYPSLEVVQQMIIRR
jgi:hypothetical protein